MVSRRAGFNRIACVLTMLVLPSMAGAATVSITTPAFPGDTIQKTGGKILINGGYTAITTATITIDTWEYNSVTGLLGVYKGRLTGTLPAASPGSWTATIYGTTIGQEYSFNVTVTDSVRAASATSWYLVVL